MSVSKIEICNMALTRVGSITITSFDDDSNESKLCRQWYEQSLETVLRAHPWNCAVGRETLARLAELPAFGWGYQFQLPPDCLRVLELEPQADFVIEGDRVLTDLSSVSIRYIRRITDTGKLDSLLVNVIALELSARLAFSLSLSRNLAQSLAEEKEFKMREAQAVNGLERRLHGRNRRKRLESSNWIKGRN